MRLESLFRRFGYPIYTNFVRLWLRSLELDSIPISIWMIQGQREVGWVSPQPTLNLFETVLSAYADFIKAIPAIHRLIGVRLKRDFCLFSALSAGASVHLAGTAIPIAATIISETL